MNRGKDLSFDDVIKMLEKYGICFRCGNDRVGGDYGSMDYESNVFKRTCGVCNTSVTINFEIEETKNEEQV